MSHKKPSAVKWLKYCQYGENPQSIHQFIHPSIQYLVDITLLLFIILHVYICSGVKYAHTGEPLQIIQLISKDVNGTIHHEVIINEANLRKIALHPEVKNRHVEIVSISGASGGGKSFLMNFPLMYLEKKVFTLYNI